MPSIPGLVDYKKRTFCRAVKCPAQLKLDNLQEGTEEYEKVHDVCKTHCGFSAREFHYWLKENGYLIVKPEPKTDKEDV